MSGPVSVIPLPGEEGLNGPDHVDAHRTIAFAISPYVKRKTVDSTMYSTTSMVRTMELILGLPPMSQYDAAATPMFVCFGIRADQTRYVARPARVSLTEINLPGAPDAAPDIEFNEIIWKSVKGKDAVMPAPIRSVFASKMCNPQ